MKDKIFSRFFKVYLGFFDFGKNLEKIIFVVKNIQKKYFCFPFKVC